MPPRSSHHLARFSEVHAANLTEVFAEVHAVVLTEFISVGDADAVAPLSCQPCVSSVAWL
jgi:hypothetical protein